MNTAAITHDHPIPFAAAAAAVAVVAVVAVGTVVVPHATHAPTEQGSFSTHQGQGYGPNFLDRRTTGGTVKAGQ